MNSYDFLTILQKIIPAAILIFILIFCLILLVRFAFSVMLYFAKKRYEHLKQIHQKIKQRINNKFTPKADSELFRRKSGLVFDDAVKQKNNEELKNLQTIQKINSLEKEQESAELKAIEIVDIVKPVGRWTSMILGQKLTYLISSAQLMNKNNKKGFWVSMVEAQEKAQGRQKGRSL